MDALDKIANYFIHWDGEDEAAADIKLSTEDLRCLAALNKEKCQAYSQGLSDGVDKFIQAFVEEEFRPHESTNDLMQRIGYEIKGGNR